MDPIELKDIITRLFSQPANLLPELGRVMWAHLQDNWWVIIIGSLAFFGARHLLLKAQRNRRSIRRTSNRRVERRHAKRSLLSSLSLWVMWVSYILFMMGQVGITLSSLTAGILLGGLGVAGALVAQSFLRDLLSGYYVVSEDQYGIGDYVDFGFGFAGIVTFIGMRTTRLRAPDGTVFHIRHSEFSRVGNKTQASGALLLDITMAPHVEAPVLPTHVDQWSTLVVSATMELRQTLAAVREVSASQGLTSASIADVASVMPLLVPNMTEDTMTNMLAVPATDDVERALHRAPAGVTPMFHDIEMLGLVDSTPTSATVRLRVRLREQSSRSYAMQLLRRSIFDALAGVAVSPSFTDVPEGEVIN